MKVFKEVKNKETDMYKEFIEILIIVCIVIWIFVLLEYKIENTKYKNSSYGRQSTKNFRKVLNDKGARGEYKTSQVLETAAFNNKMLFNCYIPDCSGNKTEIDIIMVSTKGIYVIENKNYSGWIFGDEESKNWCETLNGKKYFFYNPVRQNKNHIKNLEKILNIGQDKYISLITFNESAKLKKVTTKSSNLYVKSYIQLKSFLKEQEKKSDCLEQKDIEKIYQILLPGTQLSDQEKKMHAERIKRIKNSKN